MDRLQTFVWSSPTRATIICSETRGPNLPGGLGGLSQVHANWISSDGGVLGQRRPWAQRRWAHQDVLWSQNCCVEFEKHSKDAQWEICLSCTQWSRKSEMCCCAHSDRFVGSFSHAFAALVIASPFTLGYWVVQLNILPFFRTSSIFGGDQASAGCQRFSSRV